MSFVYTQPFQKSKVFLYPLLLLRRGLKYFPAQTYTAWEGVYSFDDYKLICVYKYKRDDAYDKFESKFLTSHLLFEEYHKVDVDTHLYVFDYSVTKDDYEKFIKGQYSKFNHSVKDVIINHFKLTKLEVYVKTFLYPMSYRKLYAEELDVSLSLINSIKEICTKPDPEKEILKEYKKSK